MLCEACTHCRCCLRHLVPSAVSGKIAAIRSRKHGLLERAGIEPLTEGAQDPEEALFKSLLALESDSEESQSILFPEPSVNLDKVSPSILT